MFKTAVRLLFFPTLSLWAFLSSPACFAAPPEGEDDRKISLTAEQCGDLMAAARVRANKDSAEYRPGVDVRGKPVTPADLPGGAGTVAPESIVIDIGVDLSAKYGKGAAFTAETSMGTVTVDKEGRVLYAGQVLDALDSHVLLRECAKAFGGE